MFYLWIQLLTIDAVAVMEVFVKLSTVSSSTKKGLIYRGKRLVNSDPVLHTAVYNLEVIAEKEQGHFLEKSLSASMITFALLFNRDWHKYDRLKRAALPTRDNTSERPFAWIVSSC